MILPSDFPHRFFNPLTSKHREDYIHVLLSLESVLEQSKRIALPRNALVAELRRTFHRENYALDGNDCGMCIFNNYLIFFGRIFLSLP